LSNLARGGKCPSCGSFGTCVASHCEDALLHRIGGQDKFTFAACNSRLSPRGSREPVALLRIVRLLTLILALGPGAQAAGPQEPQSSVSVTGLVRSSADIDGGGDFYVNSFRASATLGGSIAPRITASAGVKYAYENWRFGTPGTLGPVAPWSEVQGPSFDLSVSYRYSDQLAFFLGPQVGWTYETGASASDALSYGAAIGASYAHSPTLFLGVGAGVFRQIDQTRVFPFLIVNWQITDQWRLANPLKAGPTGGPGIELAYAISDRWDVAFGAAFREARFRLRSDGPTPNGIGVDKGVPLFARLSYQPSPPISVDFYAGAIVAGELRVLNSDGATVSASDYNTSPIFAISAIYTF